MTKIAIQIVWGCFNLSQKAINLLTERHPDIVKELKCENIEHIEYYINQDMNRSDPRLIEIVEELGDECSKYPGEIQIIEIPDDVTDWYIDDYDGWECVREGRVWGYQPSLQILMRFEDLSDD
jgi:hypothetical protein